MTLFFCTNYEQIIVLFDVFIAISLFFTLQFIQVVV